MFRDEDETIGLIGVGVYFKMYVSIFSSFADSFKIVVGWLWPNNVNQFAQNPWKWQSVQGAWDI